MFKGLFLIFVFCFKLSPWTSWEVWPKRPREKEWAGNIRRKRLQYQFGHGLPEILAAADEKKSGATVFGYHVSDPERYGVVDFDVDGTVRAITEKPEFPSSNYAITGLYFVDGTAPERAKSVKPSARGELEITSFLETYWHDNILHVEKMGRGYAWLDTGTHASLLDASNFVRTLTERQGLQIGSPDEIGYHFKWITKQQLLERARVFDKNKYGEYLQSLNK